jgi:para-nitrobenzyl esterase
MYQLVYDNPTLVPGTNFPIGSPHASDINLKFANTDKNLDSILSSDQSPGRLATGRHMSALWAGFARKGHPSARHVPRWPAYTLTERATMWIDAECTVVDDPHRDERLFWENRA